MKKIDDKMKEGDGLVLSYTITKKRISCIVVLYFSNHPPQNHKHAIGIS